MWKEQQNLKTQTIKTNAAEKVKVTPMKTNTMHSKSTS
ncbi:hypothetical protein BN1843_28110 [Escherichia coli]|nr:hypothetical protein BN1843_28110 [Escherichia coli]